MKKLAFFTLLVLLTLLQVAWGQWLSVWGFGLPLVLLALLWGLREFKSWLVLSFAFASGFLSDLLTGGTLGVNALFYTILLGVFLVLLPKRMIN